MYFFYFAIKIKSNILKRFSCLFLVPVLVQKTTRRTRKKTVSSSEDDRSGGSEYPLDVWYLISEYIEPEDVGTFARLCRSSYHVVNTSHFWFKLYKRYYKATPGLPERFQPDSLVSLNKCKFNKLLSSILLTY